MSEHTPEPWEIETIRFKDDGHEGWISAFNFHYANGTLGDWRGLAMTFGDDSAEGKRECTANARRIVACVNACTGLPIEALEESATLPGGFGAMAAEYLDRLKKLEAEIAKLRAGRDEWQTRAEQYETAWVNENAANCELTEESAKLRAEREELQRRVDGFRDEFLEKALEWRGISFVDEACDNCGGSGVVAYSSTATWRGGIGGQAITSGVCDKCWGSGSKIHKGVDLRKLSAALAEKT